MSNHQPTITQTKKCIGDFINLAPDDITAPASSGLLRDIKGYCKLGEFQVEEVTELILKRLARKHSQARLVLFEILAHLMERSKHMRNYLVNYLNTIMGLCLHGRTKLPPPSDFADKLHQRTYQVLKDWSTKFGTRFPQYQLAYLSLKERFPKEIYSTCSISKPAVTQAASSAQQQVTSKQHTTDETKVAPKFEFECSDELEELLGRGEEILESCIPDILGLPSDTSHAAPPQNSTVYQTVLASGLGSNRYQLEINIEDQGFTHHLSPVAREELLSIYKQLSCRFQLLVLDYLAFCLREGGPDGKLDEAFGFHSRVGSLLDRCQALQLHLDSADCEDDSLDDFEEIIDCPKASVDSSMQPWELIEESVCRQKGLPFLREVALVEKRHKTTANLVKRNPPSDLQKLYSKLIKYH